MFNQLTGSNQHVRNFYRVMDAGVRMATLRSETTDEPEEKEEYFVKLELLPRGSKSY